MNLKKFVTDHVNPALRAAGKKEIDPTIAITRFRQFQAEGKLVGIISLAALYDVRKKSGRRSWDIREDKEGERIRRLKALFLAYVPSVGGRPKGSVKNKSRKEKKPLDLNQAVL